MGGNIVPSSKRLWVQSLVRAPASVADSFPCQGAYGRQLVDDVSLSHHCFSQQVGDCSIGGEGFEIPKRAGF